MKDLRFELGTYTDVTNIVENKTPNLVRVLVNYDVFDSFLVVVESHNNEFHTHVYKKEKQDETIPSLTEITKEINSYLKDGYTLDKSYTHSSLNEVVELIAENERYIN